MTDKMEEEIKGRINFIKREIKSIREGQKKLSSPDAIQVIENLIESLNNRIFELNWVLKLNP
jgi:hypothetical protein